MGELGSQMKTKAFGCTGELSGPPARDGGGAGGRGRLFWALVVGCVLAVPVGWLLALLILLPGMLGLFFYMLFGLLVGAFVFRVASPLIPIPRRTAFIVGGLVTLAIWSVSLAGEYCNVRGYSVYRYGEAGFAWYPVDGDAMRTVRNTFIRRSFEPEQIAELRDKSREAFLGELREKYPPGGFIGFLRWSAVGKQPIELPRVHGPGTQELKPKQRGTFWLVRLTLSLLLLGGAVISQTLGLATVPKPSSEADSSGRAEGDPPTPISQ